MGLIKSTVKNCLAAFGGDLIRGNENHAFQGVSINSRAVQQGELFFCIKGDRFDGHDFISEAIASKASGIILSHREKLMPGMDAESGESPFVIQVPDTLIALQKLARFYRDQFPVRVVGITGTNGKSTTKEMTAAIAETSFIAHKNKGNLNNHIGLPLSLLSMRPDHEVAVMEMGMSAEGEIRRLAEIARPDIGVITNISEGHLIQLKDVRGVQRAKGELFEALSHDGTAIVNADDPLVLELARSLRTNIITFGINNKADVAAQDIRSRGNEGFDFTARIFAREIPVHLPFLGACNIYNALAAMATAHSLGVPDENMGAGLGRCKLLSQRYEIIQHNAITLINDSYNANPQSMREAISTLERYETAGKKYCVIGEMRELGDRARLSHTELGEEIARRSVDILITVGETAALAAQGALAKGMKKENISTASTHQDAVDFLKKKLQPGDCVLVKGSRGAKMEEIVNGLVPHQEG